MTDLTLRTVKGYELTFQEIDDNFTNLDSEIQILKSNADSGIGDALEKLQDLLDKHDEEMDSEHAWNIANNDSEHAWNVVEHHKLDSTIDSLGSKLNTINISLLGDLDSLDGKLNTINISLLSNLDSLDGKIDSINISIRDNLDSLLDSLDQKMQGELGDFYLDDIADVNLNVPSLSQDHVLQWTGTEWQNSPLGLSGTLQFRGVVDATADAAPADPDNGDFYVQETTAGAVDGSWTGLSTVDSGDGLAWDSAADQWRDVGQITKSSVVRVVAGTGIQVNESDPARPVVTSTLAPFSTSDLSEGTNLYYTDARADTRATLRINDATTDNIDEGSSNLYYTQARFDAALAASTSPIADKVSNPLTVQGTSFDGSSPQTVTFTGSTGISVAGTVITNTAPDQTVAFTNGNGITVTGTYPNFTVTNSKPHVAYALPLAAAGTRGGAKIGYGANGKNYPVQLSSEKMFVSVPWTDNNTTYTAGNGMKLTGTKFEMTGSYTGKFTATGDVVAFSDIAVKENIDPITEALSKVEQLGGYTFNRIGETRRSLGVIAQEVQKVVPEAVHENPEGLGVAYGNLTGLLIEAVKELSAKVKELENK